MNKTALLAMGVVAAFAASVWAQSEKTVTGLKARLRAPSAFVDVGRPVWVEFSIENQTGEAIMLAVPGAEPTATTRDAALPVEHIFSGEGFAGPVISDDAGRRWNMPIGYTPPAEAPVVRIAPRGTVGLQVDLREYFPSLRSPGRYRIQWSPYGAALTSDPIFIEIAPLKRAEIQTDAGTMTVEFFYDDAPNTVANFLELAKAGFYTNTFFHTIIPGHMILGGCPLGDGTGVRRDGKKIPGEFNSRPHQKGSVSMALLNDDPNSASCQFFICNTRHPEWDGRYTVFGQLVGDESYETLDKLMQTPVNELGHPLLPTGLLIRGVRVVTAPRESFDDRAAQLAGEK